ncbi:MAG: class I SAM-dependent methyltransferase [Lapillicoccus sp.]
MTHWQTWHDAYADPGSSLSRRIRIVQGFVRDWLDETAPRPVRVVSVCAGDGRDLLEPLASRPDADRVTATLVELDPGLADRARTVASGLPGVEVRTADAGDPAAYAALPPADLVLLCGVLGNVSDADVEHVLAVLPALCADGARVVWTRTRRAPDLTPAVRTWLSENGFREVAFAPVPDSLAAVGVADLVTRPEHATVGGSRLFTFLDAAGGGTNAATLAVYEQRADRYREGLAETPAPWHLEFLDALVARLPAGAPVLELGSGTGRDAAYLLERGLALQPSDAVSAFLAQERERGLDPVEIDVLTEDLGGPWAAVVASAVLLHLTPGELAGVLDRMHAAVAPGGLLAVTLKEGDGFGWSDHKLGLPRYFTYWRGAPLRALLEQHGWLVESLDHVQGARDSWLVVVASREDPPG